MSALVYDPHPFLWRVARLAAPYAQWTPTGPGCLLLPKGEGHAVIVDWNMTVGGSAFVGVVGGLRSWSCRIPSSCSDDEVRAELSALRVRLEEYIDANPMALSRTVRARREIAQLAYEALWGAPERAPSGELRPPGHTCPQIDRAQSALRRIAWRAKRSTPLGVQERAAVDTLLAEGLRALEAVRAENAEMRAAYWAMKKNTPSTPNPPHESP